MFDGPIGPRLPSVSPDWLIADRTRSQEKQPWHAVLAAACLPHCSLREAGIGLVGWRHCAALWTVLLMFIQLRKGGRHEQIGDILRSWEPTRVRRRRGFGLLLVDGVSPSALRSPWLHFNSLASGFFFVFFFHNPFMLTWSAGTCHVSHPAGTSSPPDSGNDLAVTRDWPSLLVVKLRCSYTL